MLIQQPAFQPDFSRVCTAILCQGEPDHLPLVEFTVWQGHKHSVLGHPVNSIIDEIDFAKRVGHDFVPFVVGLQNTPQLIAAMESTESVNSTNTGLPKGAGEVKRNWASGVEAAISTDQDFEAFPWPDPDQFDYSPLALAEQHLPGNMKVVVQIGKVFNAVLWLMGFETFSYVLFDNPGLKERMFERVGEIQMHTLKRCLDFPCVGAYLHADDVAYNTSTMVSPTVLHHYAFPWFRQMVEMTHSKGLLALLHSDGKLDDIFDDIIGLGFDGLHPIDPVAMDIVKTKELAAGRIDLIGNIDLVYTLPNGTPGEVDAQVRERIQELAPGGGYCLSSANSIPDYVPIENYVAMHNAWLKYGRYPISTM
jgi:uroporphyrinogen decarboxylase